MAEHGYNKGYPKIDLYYAGKYVCTTRWSKTLKQAKTEYIRELGILGQETNEDLVTAEFQEVKE